MSSFINQKLCNFTLGIDKVPFAFWYVKLRQQEIDLMKSLDWISLSYSLFHEKGSHDAIRIQWLSSLIFGHEILVLLHIHGEELGG